MKSLKQFEKDRIMNMQEDTHYCICPNCKLHVFPRFVNYSVKIGYPYKSNLYWCPICLKGEAGIFWREVE